MVGARVRDPHLFPRDFKRKLTRTPANLVTRPPVQTAFGGGGKEAKAALRVTLGRRYVVAWVRVFTHPG